MLRAAYLVLSCLAVSACGGGGAVQSAGTRPAMPMASDYGRPAQGLVGADARHLAAMLGAPRLDIRDRTVRKLQFVAGRCIIDAYLYAPARGREPVATHVDARLATGEDVEIAACNLPARN